MGEFVVIAEGVRTQMDGETLRGALADELLVVALQFLCRTQHRSLCRRYIHLGHFLGGHQARIADREAHVEAVAGGDHGSIGILEAAVSEPITEGI